MPDELEDTTKSKEEGHPGKSLETVVWGDRYFSPPRSHRKRRPLSHAFSQSYIGGQGEATRSRAAVIPCLKPSTVRSLCLESQVRKNNLKEPRRLPRLRRLASVYGASPRNSTVTDGKTSLRSLAAAVFMLHFNGKLIWKRLRRTDRSVGFGEGTAPLTVTGFFWFSHEAGSSWSPRKRNGKELWQSPEEPHVEHAVAISTRVPEVIVAATKKSAATILRTANDFEVAGWEGMWFGACLPEGNRLRDEWEGRSAVDAINWERRRPKGYDSSLEPNAWAG